MKTGTRKILVVLTVATLLLGSLTACGTRGPSGWSEARATEMSEKMVKRIGNKLDLNTEQKIRLDAVAAAMKAQRKAFRGDSENPRDDIRALIASDKFDRSKAQAMLEQKTTAVQQQGPKVLTALADFYDSLTPEQQQQVRARMDKRRGGRGWRGPGF
ncbi:MAG: Spy/CpxP family protein refolding chaperone [Gammaproteobacteria bacterium]|nr:Spy/CpxP family protein refolding chaperone [Gammaproteobacteria bacterium]